MHTELEKRQPAASYGSSRSHELEHQIEPGDQREGPSRMEILYSQPTVQALFKVDYQYQVPAYQRPYAWQSSNVDDFWGDIAAMGSGVHFLGPMVLHDTGDGFRNVIDGQQRLTTLQMLLALIRDKYIELGDPARKPDGSGPPCSVAPESLIRDSGYETRFFLRTGDYNRKVLEEFILTRRGDVSRKSLGTKKDIQSLKKVVWAKNKPLVDAYRRLSEHLDKHLKKSSSAIEALRDLEEALVRRVSLVVLDLKSLDDAFLLFETLNDRGLRLSAADLLKSHLLSRFDQKHEGDQTALDDASDSWDALVDGLGGGDISVFLRHYLLMRHERVKKSDVFPFFKKDVAKVGPDKTLKELSTMGDIYADFLKPPADDDALFEVLTNLKGTAVDTHRIALMPARAFVEPSRFLQFARVAEILSFRWTVVGANAQELESIYQEAASTIYVSDGQQVDAAEQVLIAKFPSDARFKEEFAAESLGYQYVAAYVLRKIENALDSAEKTIKPSQEVHVEHIMPKSTTDFWAGRVKPDELYEVVVQRWGNLTLLHAKLNESVSNGDWAVKRFGRKDKDGNAPLPGYKGSAVTLTTDLVSLDDWTTSNIELRAKWLAEVAVEVWSIKPDLSSLPSYDAVVADPSLLEPPQSDSGAQG